MKIISKGVDPKTMPIMATCNKCGTTVEFMPSEAKYSSDQRDGDFYTVECPVCTGSITQSARRQALPDYYPVY
jgi:endogenous inhibitor of DNA gyrase (YacG/DUF329 family)